MIKDISSTRFLFYSQLVHVWLITIHAIQTIQVNYIVHIVYAVVYVYKSKKGYLDISEAIDYKQFITVAK